MRGVVSLLLFVVALVASPVQGDPAFPYSAYVTGDNVHVRSGPGMNFCPTDKLQKGDQVEVYRHDPGGWYAIRPPRNSFSWVSARHVEKTADGLGRATDAEVVVRVGSRLSNVRDVVQVRLDLGEPVEILETFNAGGQTWYKIAPPSGEFRWMFGRYLSTTSPGQRPTSGDSDRSPAALPPGAVPEATTSPISANRSAGSPPPAGGVPISEVATPQPSNAPPYSASDQRAEPAAAAAPPRRDQWQSRGQADSADPRTFDPARMPVSTSPRPWQADRPAIPDRQTPRSAQLAPTGSASDQVARLEQQLSVIVAEDPATWQFSELRQVASRLLVDASAATERGRVRHVLNKIARFEDIQQRRAQIGNAPTLASRSGRGATSSNPVGPATARVGVNASGLSSWLSSSTQQLPTAARSNSPFDGVGILRPVVTRRRDAPRYALVDNAGQVVSFVTPGPGVNLQPYLGRRIGVRGNRGYIPELRRTNVMARRITALDPATLR